MSVLGLRGADQHGGEPFPPPPAVTANQAHHHPLQHEDAKRDVLRDRVRERGVTNGGVK